MNRKISINCNSLVTRLGDEKGIHIAKEIGAEALDYSITTDRFDVLNSESIYSKSDSEIVKYFENIKAIAYNEQIEIGQTHGRITLYRPGMSDFNASVIENARRDCLATAAMGAPVTVMHGVTTMFMGADVSPEVMRDLNYDIFCKIIPFAKEYGVKIATESFGDATGLGCCDFFGNFSEFKNAYERICSTKDYADYFTVCVDTGHTNKAMRFNSNPTPADFIRKIGKNVSCLHLNDNDGLTDQHKFPLSGTIDFNDVFDALDEIGYNGNLSLELAPDFYGERLYIDNFRFAIQVLKNFLSSRNNK